MNRNLEQATRRTQQYWYVDGLAEITIGLLFLLFGLTFGLAALLPDRSWLGILPVLAFPLIFVAGRYLRRWLDKTKARLTYPRTGYVSYQRKQIPRKLWLLIGLPLTVGLLALAFLAPDSARLYALLDGVLAAFVSLVMGHGLKRFYVLAGIAFLTGALLSLAGLAGNAAHGAFYTLFGLALMVSGLLTLNNYLRAHPDEPEENA